MDSSFYSGFLYARSKPEMGCLILGTGFSTIPLFNAPWYLLIIRLSFYSHSVVIHFVKS
jgi:hypothetical protein